MKAKFDTKTIVTTGLLVALSILIPMLPFKVVIPPFTATIASHVPVILAMFINPLAAAVVGFGSMLGFFINGMPAYVVARAAVHIVFAFMGAVMYQKGMSIYLVLFITMFIHGILEAIVVIPFGFPLEKAGIVVGVGTMLHHIVDSIISVAVFLALQKAGFFKKPELNRS